MVFKNHQDNLNGERAHQNRVLEGGFLISLPKGWIKKV
jgi:hypothetical protein